MATTGIVLAAIGALLFFIGMGLHLNNMRLMFNRDFDERSGGKFVLPFVVAIPGSLMFVVGVILFIIGYVIPLFL